MKSGIWLIEPGYQNMTTMNLSQLEPCKELFRYLDREIEHFQKILIRICEVPAPTFQEQRRGEFYLSLFQDLGYSPRMDEAGNVQIPILERGRPHLVVSAHLDTVFPFETIHVEQNRSILYAPGISDDSAGLAALYVLAPAFRDMFQPATGSLTFLATVGEEGLGNLRGARHYFESHSDEVDYFISLDGSDAERIVTVGLASKRVRVSFHGPGGHSWGDAGLPNPIHISGEFLSGIQRLQLPHQPKTAINVGIIQGGTSINTIPREVSMDIDMRSEDPGSLMELDEFVRASLTESVKSIPYVSKGYEVLGERPAGSIQQDHPLVQLAVAANRHFGLNAKTETGSTDSNIPFALGIPALTMGVGGKSGKIHTPEEWYDVNGIEKGLKRTALLIAELLHLQP